MRPLAALTALIAIAIGVTWIAAGRQLPAPASSGRLVSPLALVLQIDAAAGFGAFAPALAWSIVIDVVLAAFLALVLTLRSATNPHANRLALALGCLSAGVSLLFIATAFAPFDDWIPRRFPDSPAFVIAILYHFVIVVVAFALLGVGTWTMTRFWLTYPTPVDLRALSDYVRHRCEQAQAEGKRLLGHFFPTDEGSSARAVARLALLADMDGWHAGALAGSLARRCAVAAAVWWTASAVAGVLHLRGLPGLLVGGLVLCVLATTIMGSFNNVAYIVGFRVASETGEDRRRIEWLPVVGAWGHLVSNAIFPFAFAVSMIVAIVFPEHGDELFLTLVLLSFVLPLTLLPGFLVLALGAAMFGRGLVDPRLALRRVSVWSLLALCVAFLFVFVERAVAMQVVHWFDLPAESGMLVASAVVAVTILPLRLAAEKWVNRFLQRRLPARLLATGDTHVGAVAVVDIAGFTALSAHDEPAALLATTLLQREAGRLADAASGRIVKCTGDGALLAFDRADDAAQMLRELHATFARGLEALSLPQLKLHSGAHWGEYVDIRGLDIYGQTVNIASRVADAAAPGEILVSEAFVKALATTVPAPLPAGTRRFKNVPEPVECLRL